jgi:proteasome lid subunit RPN8/RPN11
MIRLWRANPKDMSVQPVDVKPFPVRAFGLGEWKVFLDGHLEQQLDQLRRKDLPNETGGILIGMTDVERRTIHIVAGLPVPADSDCYPCCFIRGSKGLRTEWERIRTVTQNELDYVGEWHSHPDGATIAPSSDDKKVMKWVREHMGAEGGPGLVLIAGEKAFALYLGADGNLRCKVPWQ